MQDHRAELPVHGPGTPAGDTHFDDATAAVDRLCTLYDAATEFLRDRFLAAMAKGHPGVRFRAFYPEIRITTTSHVQVDSRLSFGHVAGPGTYATTVTRPDLFRQLPDASRSVC